MSALSITNPAPSERRLTGGILFLLAGLAALARPRRKMMGFAARLGKNSSLAAELVYDSFYDESHIEVRREPGAGESSAGAG